MRNLVLILMLGLCSCRHIYGLKRVRTYSQKEIEAWNTRHGIKGNAALDSTYKQSLSENFDDRSLRKDLQQPLQYWLFDNGKLVSNMVNCDATGFPNLKWPIEENYNGGKIHAHVPDTGFYRKFLQVQRVNPEEHWRIMVIDHTRFMGRQSKRFLRSCRAFLTTHPEYKPYYNNMDNTFSGE